MDATLGDPAGVPGRRAATAGSWRSTRSSSDPEAFLARRARARRRDGRAAHRAGLGGLRPGLRARAAEHGVAVADPPRRSTRRSSASSSSCPRLEALEPIQGPRAGRPGAPADALQRRRGRAGHPLPRRLPPRPDHARRARLGGAGLRGRAGAPAAPAAPEALAAARRRRDAALLLLRRRGLADPARHARARRLGGARAGQLPRGLLRRRRLRRCCRPARRPRQQAARRSSSSRRRSTSCATSSTTGPTGSASRWPGIVRLLESNGGT